MTLSPPAETASPLPAQPRFVGPVSLQRISKDGRILVSRKGWFVRIVTITAIAMMVGFTLYGGLQIGDPLVVYSTIMPFHSIVVLGIGWFLYKSPTKEGPLGDELVSVIIPVYNQKGMIDIVIDSIYRSTYGNIEIIAVNDGSKDGTKEVLDGLAKTYPNLKVIHKKNEGKRKAVATGFNFSKGKYVVLIDSDSVLEKNAVTELIRAFKADPKIGGVVGHVKVWNSDKNTLTKCQDVWYDFAFNVHKACESYFGSVTCISGCLAAYRRDVVMNFIPYWANSPIHFSDDRQLTSYVLASNWAKEGLKEVVAPGFSQKLMESAARYDDSEDRVLTAQALATWKTVYVATAIAYTDVPEKLRGFFKQQERWKKGYLRTNFFVSSFFWHRRHPLMSLVYYTEFMTSFTAPLIVFTVLFYEPFILKQYMFPVFLLGSLLLKGVAVGLDYKYRDPAAKNWKYKPLMNIFGNMVLSWILFPALWNFRKNRWLTR
ncbi:MAG: glycosyltransferase [Thermoproteota archaeon]